MAYLEVANLTKKYQAGEGIENLSFSLEKGEILAILGASGSGKTTLLRCLVGLSPVDQGTVVLASQNLLVANPPFKKSPIGLVFQNFQLFPHLKIWENVALAPAFSNRKKSILLPRGWKKNSLYRQTAEQALAQVGMATKANNYPFELSGGQQQRVAIARALALEPDILAFDEPTSALDPNLKAEVTHLFEDLRASGKTMIVVTHDIDFAKAISGRILFLDQGKMVEMGLSSEVFAHPRSASFKTFLGQ